MNKATKEGDVIMGYGKVLASKKLSYGTVELYDSGNSWARYSIRLNGKVREVSDDLDSLKKIYEKNYY